MVCSYKGGKFFTAGSVGGEIQATYNSGGVFETEFIITAHHRGVLTLRLCDQPNVTEECLQKYPPLQRVRFEDDNLIRAQPINPSYPEFFYLNPRCALGLDSSINAYRMKARWKLPDGVACENCVLQMWWTTGEILDCCFP